MKNKLIKMLEMSKERMLWILTIVNLCFCGVHYSINVSKKEANMNILLETYKAESMLKTSQLNEYIISYSTNESAQFNRGFESGRTQAGVAFMNKGALTDYADGYHAALEQFEVGFVTPRDLILSDQEKPASEVDENLTGGK